MIAIHLENSNLVLAGISNQGLSYLITTVQAIFHESNDKFLQLIQKLTYDCT